MGRHYLDYASTSPLRPEAASAMTAWLDSAYCADPGRLHSEALVVRGAIEQARDQVADLFEVSSRQVVFTSGATESVNTASWAASKAVPGGVFLASGVEHSSVVDSSQLHGRIEDFPVDRTGTVDVDALASKIDSLMATESIALVHCQLANHEVGTIQPIDQVVDICRQAGVPVHCDASAAAGHVGVDLSKTPIDYTSVSAHKFGGPPGVGALILRRGLRITPLIVGGSQERARRGGSENTLGIIGFGAAAQGVARSMETEQVSDSKHRDRIIAGACAVDGVTVFGSPTRHLPHIACLGIEGVEAEPILVGLDRVGVAVHSGSSCSSETLEPSPVLRAMGVDSERSLRVSVGWSTTEEDVEAFVGGFADVVSKLRALAS